MTRDDILRMARDAYISHIYSDAALVRFAALVAAAEREAFAQKCDRGGFAQCDAMRMIERLRAAKAGDKKCRHPDACERDADGYCAKCHEEMR